MSVYTVPESLKPVRTHYCLGCGHGITHRIIGEIIDEMKQRENVIAVAPVGCAVLAYDYFNFDMSEAPHGRAPAIATGIKRSLPDKLVFTYQGDGDLLAIGISELIHSANRGEKITIIFVNNVVYGMTGGQMAPTTLSGQKTLTTPYGRDEFDSGAPLDAVKLLQNFSNVKFLARGIITNPKEIRKTKNYIKKAFEIQLAGTGFSLVEILSPCPTYWSMSPANCIKHVSEVLVKQFEPGIYKDL